MTVSVIYSHAVNHFEIFLYIRKPFRDFLVYRKTNEYGTTVYYPFCYLQSNAISSSARHMLDVRHISIIMWHLPVRNNSLHECSCTSSVASYCVIAFVHLFLRSEFWRILRTTIWTRWCASDFLIKLWNYCAFLFFVICSIVMYIFGLEVRFFWRENNGKSPTKYGSHGEFPHRICALIPTKRVLAYFWSHYFRSLMYMFFS